VPPLSAHARTHTHTHAHTHTHTHTHTRTHTHTHTQALHRLAETHAARRARPGPARSTQQLLFELRVAAVPDLGYPLPPPEAAAAGRLGDGDENNVGGAGVVAEGWGGGGLEGGWGEGGALSGTWGGGGEYWDPLEPQVEGVTREALVRRIQVPARAPAARYRGSARYKKI
jgi:hypothetical protein